MGNYNLRIVSAMASLMIVAMLTLSGCAKIRLVTYPDSIVWIDAGDVRSAMHTMAATLRAIEELISSEAHVGEHREKVLDELYVLETTAQSLSADKASASDDRSSYSMTNHLLIDDHLDEFTESLLLAQLQVQAMPPNYYRAGTLVGSCNACHSFRRS